MAQDGVLLTVSKVECWVLLLHTWLQSNEGLETGGGKVQV